MDNIDKVVTTKISTIKKVVNSTKELTNQEKNSFILSIGKIESICIGYLKSSTNNQELHSPSNVECIKFILKFKDEKNTNNTSLSVLANLLSRFKGNEYMSEKQAEMIVKKLTNQN